MSRTNRELWLAFAAILVISLAYMVAVTALKAVPPASGLVGHGIGILGFILMLMTEALYTLRKRSRSARWGRVSTWLKFHVFSGIVGPFMVLLHTSWKFQGLAGVVMLLTVVIVISGFIGRYIYTAVPRTADGAEIEADELDRQGKAIEGELLQMMEAYPDAAQLMTGKLAPQAEPSGAGVVLGRFWSDWRNRWQWQRASRGLPVEIRSQAARLEQLQKQRAVVRRQMASLAMARRMLGLWHTIHIPIGAALFTAAFIHAGAALYYATLLK
jgi:hypothetical protein